MPSLPSSPYCLDAGDMAWASKLFMWECNGYPQQQFNLDEVYQPTNDKPPYQGGVSLANGQCLDGMYPQMHGSPAIISPCNGYKQQMWSICHEFFFSLRLGPLNQLRQWHWVACCLIDRRHPRLGAQCTYHKLFEQRSRLVVNLWPQ